MKKDQILLKQLRDVGKQEREFLDQKDEGIMKSAIASATTYIQDIIPSNLIITLNQAFYRGFQLVFEKGSPYIEKTYNKDKIQLEHELNNFAVEKYISPKHIKKMDKRSKNLKAVNESIAVLEGGVLGFFGIGLPDIPLFISVIIRTINEIALAYGFEYGKDEEKAYALYLICGAMTKGERRKDFDKKIEHLGKKIDSAAEPFVDLEGIMRETAVVLADSLLVAKFVQGLPIVGIVGGMVNPYFINQIGKFAKIKYKKRYLLRKLRDE